MTDRCHHELLLEEIQRLLALQGSHCSNFDVKYPSRYRFCLLTLTAPLSARLKTIRLDVFASL